MSDPAPQRRELNLQGGSLSFLEWNEKHGLPPLHFAHANGFNAETYKSLLGPLSSQFHIRAWDARGHGRTTLSADPATHTDWYPFRDDLIALLEDFVGAAHEPVLLAGHSLGATVSLLAAAMRPDLVRGILLVEPVMMPGYVRWLSRLSRLTGARYHRPALIEAALRRRSIFASREEMLERYRGRGAFKTWPDQMVADYIAGGTHLRSDGQVELSCAPEWEAASFSAQAHNPYVALRKFKGPISLLYAGHDSTCWPPAPKRIAARGGKTKVRRVDDATHFLPMEFPDIVRTEILDFHRRIAG